MIDQGIAFELLTSLDMFTYLFNDGQELIKLHHKSDLFFQKQ